MNAATLLELRTDPPRMGRLAMARRRALFSDLTAIAPAPASEPGSSAILRDGAHHPCPTLPTLAELREGDRVIVEVALRDDAVEAYARWLESLAETPLQLAVAPCSAEPAGTHRLWLIAAARLALPANVRVEARHDRVGIRLAQVALGFGADTLSGPIEADRKLPVAGVTRPTEATWTGLRNLVEQASLTCQDPR